METWPKSHHNSTQILEQRIYQKLKLKELQKNVSTRKTLQLESDKNMAKKHFVKTQTLL